MNGDRSDDPRDWFAQRLDELWQAAGRPKLDRLAKWADVRTPDGLPTGKVLSAWKTGTNLPKSWNRFAPVLKLLIGLARQRDDLTGRTPGLDNPHRWQSWWEDARSAPGVSADKAPDADGPRRWRLIPVAECQPSWVGVHRAAEPDPHSAADDATEAPAYVPREFDQRLRQNIGEAANTGGFILVVGGSSVGKSRSLYEAIRAELPSWAFLLADDAAAVRNATTTLPPCTVVWLDDTPALRYLTEVDGGGLTRSDLLRLLQHSAQPVIVVDMMWSQVFNSVNTIPPTDGEGQILEDTYRDAREVVALADYRIEVPAQLTIAERGRAAALAANDPRLGVALEDKQFGFTQCLAGAPELVQRWLHGDPYSTAVITAAVDCCRLGVDMPFDDEMLRQAAVGYLSARQRPNASRKRFDTALESALAEGRGTSAPLLPCLSAGNVAVVTAGYELADFLVSYGLRLRALSPIPGTVWEALIDHQPMDDRKLHRLARRAHARALLTYAGELYLRSAAAGRYKALVDFARLLHDQGRADDLRALARHNYEAGRLWAQVLNEKGQESELRTLAIEEGHVDAIWSYLDLLNRQGRLDEGVAEVMRLMNPLKWANWIGEISVPAMLLKLGRVREVSDLAAVGNEWAANLLDKIDLATVVAGTNSRAPEPTSEPAPRLPRDQLNEAIDRLRERAAHGDLEAIGELANVLADHDEADELRLLLVATGSGTARARLGGLHVKLGRTDDLNALVRNGLEPDGTIASDSLHIIVGETALQWSRP